MIHCVYGRSEYQSDELGDQLSLVTTREQHLPSLWNILKFGLDNSLSFRSVDLSRFDPLG